jgi:Ca2+-binding RTX toxin-like protein
VSWDVQDNESPVTARTGCDPSTVASDTAGSTFTCEATSVGGTGSASTIVRRDVTPPTVTCTTPAPSFDLYQVGAWVTASVADATSGAASPVASGPAATGKAGSFTTNVTGVDRAGNRATTSCAYRVVVPTCRGLAPTIVGTALNDTINATNGRDVIVALGGADTINARGGDDVICGGDGPDTVDAGDGADVVDGGASPDDLSGGDGNDTLDGGAGNDSLRGGNGTDTCISGETRLSSCER